MEEQEDFAAKVKKVKKGQWPLPKWFETAGIKGYDQEQPKGEQHYTLPGLPATTEIYNAAYVAAQNAWELYPEEKDSYKLR